MEVQVISNCGAYGAASVGTRTGMMASGPYEIENMSVEVLGVHDQHDADGGISRGGASRSGLSLRTGGRSHLP